jgi:hypothetical protein
MVAKEEGNVQLTKGVMHRKMFSRDASGNTGIQLYYGKVQITSAA